MDSLKLFHVSICTPPRLQWRGFSSAARCGVSFSGPPRMSSEVELDAKTLHHLRKKKERKVLRKLRKERREKRRLQELARIPVEKPKYHLMKFEKPLTDWNLPRRNNSATRIVNADVEVGDLKGTNISEVEREGADEVSDMEGAISSEDFAEFEREFEHRWRTLTEVENCWGLSLSVDEVVTESCKESGRCMPANLQGWYADLFNEGKIFVRCEVTMEQILDEAEELLVDKSLNEEDIVWKNQGIRPEVEFSGGQKSFVGVDHRNSGSDSAEAGCDECHSIGMRGFGATTDRPQDGNLEPGDKEECEQDDINETEASKTKDEVGRRQLQLEGAKLQNEAYKGGLSGQEIMNIIIGSTKGKPVYLSMEDADRKNCWEFPRGDIDERKQLTWLAKQLNAANTRTRNVHFSRLIRSGGLKLTDGRVVELLQMLGELGDWRCAMRVVEWISTRNHYPQCRSKYVYTTLLAVLGRSKRPKEALTVFNAMRETVPTYPDMAAYHSIAVTLGQAGYLEELLHLTEVLRPGPPRRTGYVFLIEKCGRLFPDVVVYNAVLNACVPHKDHKRALWVLKQIRTDGLHPNSASYGLAIEVMVKAGDLKLAQLLFAQMERGGYHPNATTYRVLVEALAQQGKVEVAIAKVEEMERRGVLPSVAVYYSLACALCSSGRWKEAILQIAKTSNLPSRKPDVVFYTGLIRACGKAGLWRDAISVFEVMKEACAPNIGTYNLMISLHGRNKMFEEAMNLFELVKSGRLCSSRMYKNDARLVPDSFTYEAMLGACAVAKRWKDLDSVYRQMVLQGFHLNINRHNWILSALSAAGEEKLVERMITHLEKYSKVVPKSEVFVQSEIVDQTGDQKCGISYVHDMMKHNLRSLGQTGSNNTSISSRLIKK